MGKISDQEVRRLVSYLKQYVDDEDLAEIEDELRGDEAEELLRETVLLEFFPELSEELSAADKDWQIIVIPHAHLRMVQRGVKVNDVCDFISSFIKLYVMNDEPIFVGHYAIYGRISQRNISITIRFDLDVVTDAEGKGHIVTVYMGRGNTEGITEVDLL